MCCKILLISLLLVSVQQGMTDLTYRKFVYQKDMSEYCRRRVMPSVFLGRQVVDANSQILHFSRLEVPYSCYITVRTEMGSNIIVVIQVVTDVDIESTCKSGHNQLLIHEMGETFGGYWGQMPDSVMKRVKSRNDRSYTLKPTPPHTAATTATTERTTITKTKKNKTEENKTEDEGEYLTVELPIMNVSAKIVKGKMEPSMSFTTEDAFDLIYDVTPRSGVSYDTQVVPLLEVGIPKLNKGFKNRYKSNQEKLSAKIPFNFNDLFTPDPRLILTEFSNITSPRKVYKYHPNVNRRLDFKKHKNLFVKAREDHFNKKLSFNTWGQQSKTMLRNNYQSTHYDVPKKQTTQKTEETHNYWNDIHDILKILSNTSEVPTEPPHEELANILRGAFNKGYNKSLYLSPDLSYFDLNGMTEIIATTREAPYTLSHKTIDDNDLNDTSRRQSSSQDFNQSFNMPNVPIRHSNYSTDNNDSVSASLVPVTFDVDSFILNVTNENKNKSGVQNITSKEMLEASATTNVKKSSESIPVSLVDHESWENVVNSASVMAVKLNETTLGTVTMKSESVTKKKRKRRKKRYLHAIDIAVAQPQHVQKMKHITTTKVPDRFNARELQRHVEMQDDEVHDRMAMRYLKQYMGPPLLDFCDFNETSTRFVYLFNSSRLVLSISNFTLRRMTVVVTPASTLLDSNARCGREHLECQVSGARVCIDSLCACDGVPNCGSYDIYDEDRLSCGAAAGFRHNVCLAAVTFLAVLLTILYTVHYWLKRCVPRVSDAFFIYTDAAENVLYLDSIMRSPHDMGVGKDFLRGVQELYQCEDKTVKKNACIKFLSKCLLFLRFRRKKKKNEEPSEDFDQLYSERISAFAELEIKKIAPSVPCLTDVACQTGSNLKIEEIYLATIHSNAEDFVKRDADTRIVTPISLEQDRVDSDSNQPVDELNMLKFFRRSKARSISLQFSCISDELISRSQISSDESKEKEIYCQEYQEDQLTTERNVIVNIHEPRPSKNDKIDIPEPKQVRFQDDAIVIPGTDDEVDKEVLESTPQNIRRSIVFGANKVYRIQDTKEEPREVEEPNPGTGRELKSYFNWVSNKEKKKKKPTKKK